MKKILFFFIILLIIILSGCQIYDDGNQTNKNTPIITPNPLKDQYKIRLYYPDKYNEKLLTKDFKIKNPTRKLEIEILEKLMDGTDYNEVKNLIPKNTMLRSIDIENQIAYINFSGNIKEEEMTNSEEILLVYSIVNTMTELDSIKSVQFLINGEKDEVLSRIFNIKDPISYSELIKKEYISPIETIEKYYDILNSKDLNNLYLLFENTDKKNRIYYEMQYLDNNIKEYNIKSYKINSYKKEILVDVKVQITKEDGKKVQETQVFSMIYNEDNLENTFKINEIY